ncbi:MAG TPA: cobalt ECF transporter T component CbiQ [Thermomicrobiales bacterium]|nr:cobalt ECF transporter T component CbiQ [Thermomicrobiales bacterium]
MSGFAIGERYHHGEGLLYRADPRVKILIAVLFAFGVTSVPEGNWPAYAGFGAVAALAMAASRVPPVLILVRSVFVLPFIAAAIPLIFTRPGETMFGVPLLGWTASVEGVVAVGSIMLKSWLSVLVAIVLTSTTRPIDLIRGLERLRLPRVLAATVFFMYRYLFVIGAEGQRMMRARDSRSAESTDALRSGGSLAWRGRVLGNMVGSLFIRSFERSERIHAAMQARGYDGTIRFAAERGLVRADWLLLWCSLAALLGLTLIARY